MRFNIGIYILSYFSLLLCSSQLNAQQEKVKIKNADRVIASVQDQEQTLLGNVKMVHDSIFMFCDSAWVHENYVISVGEVIMVQEDTINVFSDSLYYNSESKLAELYKNVVLENGERNLFTNFLIYDLESKIANFKDTAIMQNGSMQLSSIKGEYFVDKKLAYFYEEVTIIDGEMQLKTDSLRYDTDIDRAYFLGPTYITENDRKVYCESGYYDQKEGRAYFSDNAIINENDRKASAQSISYNSQDSTTTFKKDVVIIDSTSTTKGNEVILNESNNEVRIIGNGSYEDTNTKILGEDILYNKETKALQVSGPNTVFKEDGTLYSEALDYNDESDFGIATGNVIWRDTVESRILDTDILHYRDSSSYFKAIVGERRPLLKQLIEDDTLYISADTLMSFSVGDTMSYLEALGDVRIFKSDLQGVCDSLSFSDQDSILQLFKNPITWSDSTQFLGDTIRIYLENEEVSEIVAEVNGFLITKDQGKYYNQIKAKYLHSYLDSNKLTSLLSKGNAESLYLVKDEEEAYVGPNKTLCSEMTFYFKNDEIETIHFITEPSNILKPIEKTSDSDLYLDGFIWHEKKRPLTIQQVRNRKGQNSSNQKFQSEPEDEFEAKINELTTKENMRQDSIKSKEKK